MYQGTFYKILRINYLSGTELADLGAVHDRFLRGDEAHFAVALLGHQDHTLGLDAADGAGSEVREDADLLAQHVFRAVVLGDAGDDSAGVDARVDGELQQPPVRQRQPRVRP